MPDLGRSGDHVQSLGARVHDAVTVVAASKDAIYGLQGLALTILSRPIADINEIFTELDRFDRTEQRYIEIGRAADDGGRWQTEIGGLLNLAFELASLPETPPSLAPTSAVALSLATGIELWRQENAKGEAPLLAFSVATPATTDQEAVRLTFAEPRATLVLHAGSLAVAVIVGKVVSFGRWAVKLFCGTAGRLRSPEAAALAFVENLRTARNAQDPKPLPLLRLDERSDRIPGKTWCCSCTA